METKCIKMEFDCVHDQAAGTMTCSWLGGRVQIVCDWKSGIGVVLVRGKVRDRFVLADTSVQEFMRIEEQVAEAAVQLAAFEPRGDAA